MIVSVMMDSAAWQIPRSTERISSFGNILTVLAHRAAIKCSRTAVHRT